MDRTIRGSIPTGSRHFSLLQNVQNCSGAHRASCAMGTGVLSQKKGDRGRKVDLSPPSSADVRNEWSYSFYSIRLHNADRDKLTLTWVHQPHCTGRLNFVPRRNGRYPGMS